MKKELYLAIIAIVIIVCCIIFCGFAGHNDLSESPNSKDHIAGFWAGLAHGFIIIIGLVVSIFDKNIGIYEIHNTGLGYNIGFLIGIFMWVSSSKLLISKK